MDQRFAHQAAMAIIAVIPSPRTFAVSLGAVTDLHARLGEVFETNEELGAYSQVHTQLVLAPATGTSASLADGQSLACPAKLSALRGVRLVYLPSFQATRSDQIDDVLAGSVDLHHWLATDMPTGVPVGAAGASVFHLAAAGLLDNQRCVVPIRLAGLFRERFPRVRVEETETLCVSGRIVTCNREWHGGALALRLFAEAFSPVLASNLALREPPEGDPGLMLNEPDPLVARARTWIRDRFATPFRIADLARELGVSHQTLIRRFRASGGRSPRGYAQELRVHSACSMLSETRRSVAEIAQLVGYRDMATFRRVFVEQTGVAPAEYRRSRGRAQPN